MPAQFNDHFSSVAAAYAAVRPHYPDALYAFLAGLAPDRERAWDCATGNGQAALGLASYFDEVVATDASEAQIALAPTSPVVSYHVASAEQSPLPPRSVSLITVAQAVHWFDLEGFYREVRRVARPGAVLALWSYAYFHMSPAVDRVIGRFAEGTLRECWPPERDAIIDRYRSLPFPFAEVAAPSFAMVQPLSLEQVGEYFHSWSATPRYIARHGKDPVPDALCDLAAVWGDPSYGRLAQWEIYLRVGRVET